MSGGQDGAVQRVGIVGGGIMGAGIAEVCARSGLEVILVEQDEARARTAADPVQRSLDKAVRRGKLDAPLAAQAVDRLRCVTGLDSLGDRQVVIEAVVEDHDTKVEVFRRLADVVTDEAAILASNTPSIPIVELAVAAGARLTGSSGCTSLTRYRCCRWWRSSRRY